MKEEIKKKKWIEQRRNELKSRTTSAEKSITKILLMLGITHKTQYPINTGRKQYFADVYIPSLKLILEIDGSYHNSANQKRLDENRSANLRRLGYHVCRLSNKDAYNPNKVIAKLRRYTGF